MEQDNTREQLEWLEYFMPRAEKGEPHAQLAVGIAYANGNMIPKDLEKSEFWIRISERNIGEKATFQLIKILSREESSRTIDVFNEKTEWELGAIYLIYGRFLMRNGKISLGRINLRKAWRKGSMIAGISYISSRFKAPWRIVVLPIVLPMVFRAALIRVRNENDDRIIE